MMALAQDSDLHALREQNAALIAALELAKEREYDITVRGTGTRLIVSVVGLSAAALLLPLVPVPPQAAFALGWGFACLVLGPVLWKARRL